jgi:hypothetical protein
MAAFHPSRTFRMSSYIGLVGQRILLAVAAGLAIAFLATALGVPSRWGTFITGGITGLIAGLLVSRMQMRAP